MDLILPGLLTVLLLAGLLLGNEVLVRRRRLGPVSRAVAHVGCALLVALSCLWLGHRAYVVIGIGFALLLLASRWGRRPLHSLRVRPDSTGEVLYGIGVAAAALLTGRPSVFVVAVLVLGLADPAARWVGRRVPSRALPLGRTLAGSLTVVLVSLVVVLVSQRVAGLPGSLPGALLVALLAGVAELLGPRGWDNLLLPATVALSLSLLAP